MIGRVKLGRERTCRLSVARRGVPAGVGKVDEPLSTSAEVQPLHVALARGLLVQGRVWRNGWPVEVSVEHLRDGCGAFFLKDDTSKLAVRSNLRSSEIPKAFNVRTPIPPTHDIDRGAGAGGNNRWYHRYAPLQAPPRGSRTQRLRERPLGYFGPHPWTPCARWTYRSGRWAVGSEGSPGAAEWPLRTDVVSRGPLRPGARHGADQTLTLNTKTLNPKP